MTTEPFYDDRLAISRAMQQRLQARIAQHQGAIDPVIEQVQAELTALDSDPEMQQEAHRSRFQSQRALLVAQIDYLKMVAQRQEDVQSPRAGNFWARFRRPFQRTPVTE